MLLIHPLLLHVRRGFEALSPSGHLGAEELESLLCDEEVGCLVEDTVPAAMRAAEADSFTTVDSVASTNVDSASVARQAGLGGGGCQPGGGGGRDMAGGVGAGTRQEPSARSGADLWGGKGLDLPAFAKLLRVAQQDTLELYESRRIKRT